MPSPNARYGSNQKFDFGHTIIYPSLYTEKGESVLRQPNQTAKNETGDFEQFSNFARQILSVPHAEVKAILDADKAAKRTPKSASRVSDDSTNQA